ncbi:MAG: glycerol-3-phosphate dehydrogenase [Anaerolineaceae bacterium]|nr:MAG: glycerol-3-phosphate dehydrogenase [Anaerolineaceae bacterium]
MWTQGWRDRVWSQLDGEFDLIVIGGGITGAGILREAARAGLKAVLFEQGDFASGTSSRSSKLVHGGLRYLRNAKIKLTSESVHERDHLLKEGRGLVTPLPFVMANFRGDKIPGWVFGVGLTMYDLLALKWNHSAYDPAGLRGLVPQLSAPDIASGFRYFDAQTDDARLVLRVMQEAAADGALALNYARVDGLLKTKGRVAGVAVRDLAPGSARTAEVRGRAVISATGAWADEVRAQAGGAALSLPKGPHRLRVLRGSHLFFPWSKLPLTRAVTFLHPKDGRPVFIYPWEGVTLVGTTDVDHEAAPSTDLRIGAAEAEYLMDAVRRVFPALGLTLADAQSTLAGIRAVVDTGKSDPSKESREFVLWNESGLLTVSGGKLTTFRLMAHTALRAVRLALPEHPVPRRTMRVLDPLPPETTLCDLPGDPSAGSGQGLRLRLLGRYGAQACHLVDAAHADEMTAIGPSPSLWAELRWAARTEGVVHLDDLLARRLRLNINLPGGGMSEMGKIRAIVQTELGWDDARWAKEEAAYRELWKRYYSPA